MQAIYESPVGRLWIEFEDEAITGLYFDENVHESKHEESPVEEQPTSAVFAQCKSELDEYFAGSRQVFDVKVKLDGTEFRKQVWQVLSQIPYGQTVSYKDIAIAIENPNSVRAVGGANHHNKISIIIPCHRVVGADGSLTGYGGGVWRKGWLLEHEKNWVKNRNGFIKDRKFVIRA